MRSHLVIKFVKYLKGAGVAAAQESPQSALAGKDRALALEAERLRAAIAALEEQRENLRKKLVRDAGLLIKLLSSVDLDPGDLRNSLKNVEKQIVALQTRTWGNEASSKGSAGASRVYQQGFPGQTTRLFE
jgi:hypothetical protein